MSNEITTTQPNPVSLLEMAVQNGADITQLKELMDLQERWEQKQAKKSFLEALSRFQTLVPELKKNKTATVTSRTGGAGFSYKYADLGSIANQIKEALNACGLSYRWEFAETNGKMKVTCIVSHLDGHSETTSMEAGADNSGAKNDIQQKGSTHTYLQRYTLIGALGLSTAEDDKDGAGRKGGKAVQDDSVDYLEQWKETINQVRTKIELSALYVKNKKVIDTDPAIQKLMKVKQDKLKSETTTANPATVMP